MSVVFVVAACSCDSATTAVVTTDPTTTTAPTTTNALEEDIRLIKTLYRGYSDSWFSGVNAAMEYVAQHNHPDFFYSSEECTAAAFPDGPVVGYREEVIVDGSTVDRDDGWTIPVGRHQGLEPDGTIYILTVTSRRSIPGVPQEVSVPVELHAAVLNGQAYFFQACESLTEV